MTLTQTLLNIYEETLNVHRHQPDCEFEMIYQDEQQKMPQFRCAEDKY